MVKFEPCVTTNYSTKKLKKKKKDFTVTTHFICSQSFAFYFNLFLTPFEFILLWSVMLGHTASE